MTGWPWASGEVRVRALGSGGERLINSCVGRRIPVHEVRRRGEGLTFRIPLRALRAVRAMAREAGVRLRLEGYRGLPFLLRDLRPHAGFLVGAVLSLLVLNGLAAPIWVVRVEGTSSLPPAAVRDAALRAGLRPGSLRWRLDLDAVEGHILRSLSELVWADVELRGIVALIKVAEREPLHFLPPGRAPGEVVAARDGVVVSILAVQGEAAVSPGQVVARGDVLLRPPEPSPGRMGAVGVVWARVWYTGQAAVPLAWVQYRATGRSHTRWSMTVAGREVVFRGGRVPFAHYRTDRQGWRIFGERNETGVVELSRETSWEMERIDRRLNSEEASHLAERLAEDQVTALLDPGARIMGRQVDRSHASDYARVKLTVEVLEEIGVTRVPGDGR